MECRVWSEFQYTKIDGTVCKFRVQDCPKYRMNDVIDLFTYFITDEAIHNLAGIPKSEEALKECVRFCAAIMKKKCSLSSWHTAVCIEDASNLVVGVSCMELRSTKDKIPDTNKNEPKTKEVAKLFEMLSDLKNICNIPKIYKVEKYYEDSGLIVHPDYRGFGIGSRLIESRRKICEGHGVAITSAWMTSIGSQKAAERDCWETALEIDTQEFARRFNVTPYEGIIPTFKVMVVNLTSGKLLK